MARYGGGPPSTLPLLLLSLALHTGWLCRVFASDLSAERVSCAAPPLHFNNTQFSPGINYTKVKEVQFMLEVNSITGKRKECKIKCSNGAWEGPFCKSGHGEIYHPLLQSCVIEDIPQQMALFINYQPITSPRVFHHGAVITARCREVGMYKRLGASSLLCHDGLWTPSEVPSCQPTSVLTNFSRSSPPTIVPHVPTGSAQPTTDGQLVVYPDSIVHLDCLYPRTRGNPDWEWSATSRNYPTGWAIDQAERNWKYRLSVYYTRASDSGNLTCHSPDGTENTVHIIVKAVDCPSVVDDDSPRIPSTTVSRLGQRVTFTCPAGQQLVGAASATCLANGHWSEKLPQCHTVQCPLLSITDPHLLLISVNLTHGSRAAFRCSPGHRLAGQRVIRCRQDGSWSAPTPACHAVTCPEPGTPVNGYAVRSGGMAVGDTVEHFCNPNHVMDGEASSFCTAAGTWSHSTPKCQPICEFPGTPRGGSTRPVLFSYRVGDHVQFSCGPGHVLVGMMRATCQGDGSWSGRTPECRAYTDD